MKDSSKIIPESFSNSKSLSKYKKKSEFNSKSIQINKNKLLCSFNERYLGLDNDLNNTQINSQINKKLKIFINNNIIFKDKNNQRKNNIIKEEGQNSNSVKNDSLDMIYSEEYKKFYETVKNLIIQENQKTEEISNEDIINEIKSLIEIKKKFFEKKNECLNMNENENKEENKNNFVLIEKNNYKHIKSDNIRLNRYDINDINKSINFYKQDIKISKNSICSNINKSINSVIMPEIISPENMYKIFIYCIKQFDYEEGIYNKFLNKEDLILLKKN